jgi:hypothetical protein
MVFERWVVTAFPCIGAQIDKIQQAHVVLQEMRVAVEGELVGKFAGVLVSDLGHRRPLPRSP